MWPQINEDRIQPNHFAAPPRQIETIIRKAMARSGLNGLLLLLLLALIMSASSSMPPNGPPGREHAAYFQSVVGRPGNEVVEEIKEKTGLATVTTVPKDAMVTMDFRSVNFGHFPSMSHLATRQ